MRGDESWNEKSWWKNPHKNVGEKKKKMFQNSNKRNKKRVWKNHFQEVYSKLGEKKKILGYLQIEGERGGGRGAPRARFVGWLAEDLRDQVVCVDLWALLLRFRVSRTWQKFWVVVVLWILVLVFAFCFVAGMSSSSNLWRAFSRVSELLWGSTQDFEHYFVWRFLFF